MDSAVPQANACPADVVRAALERVLASRSFQQSETLSRLLRHTVEHALEGRGDKLKEFSVGVDVFGRGASFDPRMDSIVRVEASRLRSRLAEYYRTQGAGDPVRIELPRGSYTPQFRARVAVPDSENVAAPPAGAGFLSPRWAAWALLAVFLGAIGILVSVHILRATRSTPPPQASVAVLPFMNLSPDKSDEYLSDGITEEITNTLARIPGLRVAARSAAYRFKGEGADLPDVGRKLGVATVLEGSVRTSGDTLRITTQLVDAAKGYNLWSESYDGRRAEILAIQIRIAQAIAGNLRLTLAESQGAVSIRRTPNAVAHELVLQARYMQPDSPESDARIRCYKRALALDPEYAPAYAGLADEWVKRAVEGWTSPREVMERARDATRKALQIDDTLPDAHFLSAMVKWIYEWDWSGARREFERALEINPNFADARMQYARYLALIGFQREAVDQLDQIRVLDPISPAARGVEAAVYYLAGDYDRTIRHAHSVLAGDPNLWLMYYWMGRAYDSKGQLSEAIPALERWYSMPDRLQGRGFGMLGSVYARAGRRKDAVRLLESALARSRHAHVSPTSFALIYTGLGDTGRALEWLEKAYEERDHSLVTLKTDPAYDSLRREARFVALLRKMNLE